MGAVMVDEVRKMLDRRQVLKLVPLGRSTMIRMEKEGRFPRGVYIGRQHKYWYEDEVVAWQEALPRERAV
jgi:predicted DNA-binding transcriptional regulator AlpA